MSQASLKPTGGVLLLVCAVPLAAMASGMGWGIRGQYGHETGAMIAGVLTSLTLLMLFVPQASSLNAARAAAMMAVAMGIGGSMTYGQTVGLTHDAELLGNWEALRWGLLGLAMKGAIWIGFAGAFLGMGLGGKRYRPLEMAVLLPALLGLMFAGVWLINSPFDPSTKTLPWIYFSDDWYFEPDRDLKPRPEIWGGLLVALLSLLVYVRVMRGDRLGGRMAIVGMVAGGLGFPGGQSVQAFHRWNPEIFTEGALSAYREYFHHFNWWNMMETTFGLIFGAILAFGLWINRRLIAVDSSDNVTISPSWEVVLCTAHVVLLLSSEFLELSGSAGYVELYVEYGLLMSMLPLVGIVGGRFFPYLMLLPVTAAPIAGKTIRHLVYQSQEVALGDGWFTIVQIPLAVMLCMAVWLICRGFDNQPARRFAAVGLSLSTMFYFGMNTAFFRFAWPWKEWTGRTPNQLIFSVCAVALVLAAVICAVLDVLQRRTDVPASQVPNAGAGASHDASAGSRSRARVSSSARNRESS